MIVMRPKTAHYDVYTLIKIGIDRRVYFHLCPKVFKSSIVKQAKNWRGVYGTAARTWVPSHLVPILFAGIVWVCGQKETMTSTYLTAPRARHLLSRECFL